MVWPAGPLLERFDMSADDGYWPYLAQWIEDCYYDELAAFDDILEYRSWDMPKLTKLMNSRLVWE